MFRRVMSRRTRTGGHFTIHVREAGRAPSGSRAGQSRAIVWRLGGRGAVRDRVAAAVAAASRTCRGPGRHRARAARAWAGSSVAARMAEPLLVAVLSSLRPCHGPILADAPVHDGPDSGQSRLAPHWPGSAGAPARTMAGMVAVPGTLSRSQ